MCNRHSLTLSEMIMSVFFLAIITAGPIFIDFFILFSFFIEWEWVALKYSDVSTG